MNVPAPSPKPPSQLRSRLTLLLIAAMFFASFAVALVLRFTGWTPTASRNHGTLLENPLNLGAAQLVEADGRVLPLRNNERRWVALVRVPIACDDACWQRVEMLPRVRTALGRHAPDLELRMLDAALPEARRAALAPLATVEARTPLPTGLAESPEAGPEVWLVDFHGYAVLHYPAGFDPSGLRKDLARLLK
jgi:hypothetical protein